MSAFEAGIVYGMEKAALFGDKAMRYTAGVHAKKGLVRGGALGAGIGAVRGALKKPKEGEEDEGRLKRALKGAAKGGAIGAGAGAALGAAGGARVMKDTRDIVAGKKTVEDVAKSPVRKAIHHGFGVRAKDLNPSWAKGK